jgi:CRISPR-associated protein Cas2
MLYVISYDVAEDAARRRVAEALKDYGRRVQYSVFECGLDQKGVDELRQRLAAEIDPSADSCRVYRLCEACAGEVVILGRGGHYIEPAFVVV